MDASVQQLASTSTTPNAPPPAGASTSACPAESYLRLLLDLSDDRALVPLDRDGVIAGWDKAAERLTGACREEMIGRLLDALFTAEDQLKELPRQLLRDAATSPDGRARIEHFRVDAAGSGASAETTIAALRDSARSLAGFALITRNLPAAPLPVAPPLRPSDEPAEQSEDVAELKATIRHFQTISRCLPDVVALFDAHARNLYMSESIQRMCTLPPRFFLGRTPREAAHALPQTPPVYTRLVDNWEATLRYTISSGQSQELHFNFPTSTDVHTFVTRMIPQLASDGRRVEQVVTITQDVTTRHRIETELRQAKEAAEHACSAKDQFMAMLSHELRTPLTPVLVAAREMEENAALDEDTRDSARMIHRNVELEARLIDDLLDLTRITHGKVELQRTWINVHDTLRRVVQLVATAARSVGGRGPLMPEIVLDLAAARADVSADPARLHQILWNLLNNAVKFTPPDGRVVLRTANPTDHAIDVQVIDTGVGIAPDVLPVIFNAFEQGGALVTHRFGGLGLGLAISRALADAHGGSLSASSLGAGRGATFTLQLPTVDPPPPTAAPHHPAVARPENAVRVRLLLVEDHHDTARYMARMLRTKGYDVRTASDVASAVRAAEAETFDLVVSDLGLPDGTGYDLMRQLRSMGLTRGIALSGYGMEEDRVKSRQAGFAEHLVKPVGYDLLLEAIGRVCAADEGSS